MSENVSIGTMVDRAAEIRREILALLRERYGLDNADLMFDDRACIGVGFADGSFVQVRVQIPVHDATKPGTTVRRRS